MPNPETINGFEFTLETVTPAFGGTPWQRLKSVHGRLVRRQTKSARDNTIPPVCFGSVAQVPDGYDRGHVIGLKLGGPDHTKNLVPMMAYFNRIEYKSLEQLLLAELMQQPQVYVGVVIDYMLDPAWCPLRFTVHRHFGNANSAEQPIVLSQIAYPRQQYTIPNEIYQHLRTHDAAVRKAFLLSDTAMLPYGIFEEGPAAGKWSNISHLSPGKFSKIQKEWVRSLNCYNHNAGSQTGWLRSDASDDTHPNLNPRGCLDFPEVDHIHAYSHGGTNSFWNAQLTSAIYNRSKSAKAATTVGDSAPKRKSQRLSQKYS